MSPIAAAPQERVLYSRPEAAKFFGVSVRTVDDWIKTGRIKATKFGRLVKIHETELHRLAESGFSN